MKIKKVGDFKLSLNPPELKKYINNINNSFLALGKNRSGYFKNEKNFFKTLRRSIYFNSFKKKNDRLHLKDISYLRPFDKKGINANELKKFIGKFLKRNISKDELLKKEQFQL